MIRIRRPRKTPIPANPAATKTMTQSSNDVLSAKTIESKKVENNERDKKVHPSDKEIISSPDQISVKGLAHRFSTSLKSSSQPDCLSQTRPFSGNKDFQQVIFSTSYHLSFNQKAEVNMKTLLQPIPSNEESSQPFVPPKLEPKKIKGRVTNAMLLPCHENGVRTYRSDRNLRLALSESDDAQGTY